MYITPRTAREQSPGGRHPAWTGCINGQRLPSDAQLVPSPFVHIATASLSFGFMTQLLMA